MDDLENDHKIEKMKKITKIIVVIIIITIYNSLIFLNVKFNSSLNI